MMIPQDQLDQRFGVSVEIRGNNNKLIISPVETGCQNGFFVFVFVIEEAGSSDAVGVGG